MTKAATGFKAFWRFRVSGISGFRNLGFKDFRSLGFRNLGLQDFRGLGIGDFRVWLVAKATGSAKQS